jgi:flavodoxin
VKPIVLYSSKGGNTEKVAKEISSELNCQCIKIAKDSEASTANLNDFDLVFVGTGVYASKPNSDLLSYLNGLKLKDSRQFAFFVTWFGRSSSDKDVFDKIKTAVEANGQRMLENYYKCQGEGHTMMTSVVARLMGHDARGHPNAEELSAARTWAKAIANAEV